MILTADLHLTDRPEDEYRWEAFAVLGRLARKYPEHDIVLAGDTTDRKDRHSAGLVNRLLREIKILRSIMKSETDLFIIMGNHDKPFEGKPFWYFLNEIEGVFFLDEPTVCGNLLLLPFSPNPAEDWAHLDFTRFRCAIMHQMVAGCIIEHGRVMDHGDPMISFPPGLHVYSGDIHLPQKVGAVTYIGAPHPIKFGDDYECRMLLLRGRTGDDIRFDIEKIVALSPMRKLSVSITEVSELESCGAKKGDQLKVRFCMEAARLEEWPDLRAELVHWAITHGVTIASAELAVIGDGGILDMPEEEGELSPAELLESYSSERGLSPASIAFGKAALTKALQE